MLSCIPGYGINSANSSNVFYKACSCLTSRLWQSVSPTLAALTWDIVNIWAPDAHYFLLLPSLLVSSSFVVVVESSTSRACRRGWSFQNVSI